MKNASVANTDSYQVVKWDVAAVRAALEECRDALLLVKPLWFAVMEDDTDSRCEAALAHADEVLK